MNDQYERRISGVKDGTELETFTHRSYNKRCFTALLVWPLRTIIAIEMSVELIVTEGAVLRN